MKLKAMMVGLTLAALTLPAFAQAPAGAPPTPPQRIRGTIVKLDGSTGGVLGTEASFLMYPAIALLWLYVWWRHRANQPLQPHV